MAKLILQVPDELKRTLEGIAATQRTSIQELALERLTALVTGNSAPQPGSAAALVRAMRESPNLSPADVDELDAAILAGQLPARTRDLF